MKKLRRIGWALIAIAACDIITLYSNTTFNDNQKYGMYTFAGLAAFIGLILLAATPTDKEVKVQTDSFEMVNLTKLLKQHTLVRKLSLDKATLDTMENIKARRIKLGLTNEYDNDPDYIFYYKDITTVNQILVLMPKVENETNPNQDNQPIVQTNQIGVAEELTKLKSLLDNGVLTQAEFEEQKRKILQ